MTALIALAARLGVSERYRRLLAWILALAALIALVGGCYGLWRLWLHRHVEHAIAADRKASDASVLNATIGADRTAGARQASRDAAAADEQRRLEKAHDRAISEGSDAWDAIADELRNE